MAEAAISISRTASWSRSKPGASGLRAAFPRDPWSIHAQSCVSRAARRCGTGGAVIDSAEHRRLAALSVTVGGFAIGAGDLHQLLAVADGLNFPGSYLALLRFVKVKINPRH